MNISEMYGYFENIEASHIFHLKDALRQFGKPTDKSRLFFSALFFPSSLAFSVVLVILCCPSYSLLS